MASGAVESQRVYEYQKYPCPHGHGTMELLGITLEDQKMMIHCFCRACCKFYQGFLEQ